MHLQDTETAHLTECAAGVIAATGGGAGDFGTGTGGEVRTQLEAAYRLVNRVRKTLGELRAGEELLARSHRTAGEIAAMQTGFDAEFGIPDREDEDDPAC